MATIKISALTEKATMSGTEEVLINDSGISKKFSTQRFLDVKTGAETAETNAASSATSASTSASTATTQASTATAQAVISTAQAVISTTKASDASTSATASATSATSAAASLDEFDDTYLGAKASNPSVDNDGNSIATGALYFNTTDDEVKVYDGASWLVSYNAFSGITDTATSTKLAVSNSGIDVTGTVTCDGLRVDATDSIRPSSDTSLITISGGNATNSGANYTVFGGTHASLANIHRWRTGGTERMRITSTGSVGINRVPTQTNAKLEVGGADNVPLIVAEASGVFAGIGVQSSGLGLYVGTSAKLTINSAGNMGLGVTPESWNTAYSALQIGGISALYANSGTTAGRDLYLVNNVYHTTGGTEAYIIADEATLYKQQNGTHEFKVAPSGTADDAISWTTAMTIANTGNVGIGTSSPLSLLDVSVLQSGSRRLLVNYDDSIVTIKGSNNSGNPERLRVVADEFLVSTGTVGSGTERLRITSTGNVEIRGGIVSVRNSSGVTIPALKGSQFGYSSSYRTLEIGGTTGTNNIALGVDVSTNTSGSFGGYGQIICRNGQSFIQPNTTNTGFNAPMAFGTNGVVRLPLGIALGSGLPTAPTAANTLDDYEEGTWTPTINDSSTASNEGQVYAHNAGYFTKIGDVVHCWGKINITSLGSMTTSGSTHIHGLPFNANPATYFRPQMLVGYGSSLNFTAGNSLTGFGPNNQSYMRVSNWDAGTGYSALKISELSVSANIHFYIIYKV